MFGMLSRSIVYGCDASGFGAPENPDVIVSVAFPSTCPGVDIVGDSEGAGPAAAVRTAEAALPPLAGIVLLADITARLQLRSIAPNVKSPLSFCPATNRPCT